MSYQEYLNSPTWKLIKLVAARKKEFKTCNICGSTPIQLHHKKYGKINQLGRVHMQLNNLVALCRGCHFKVHEIAKEKRTGLKRAVKILRNRPRTYNISTYE